MLCFQVAENSQEVHWQTAWSVPVVSLPSYKGGLAGMPSYLAPALPALLSYRSLSAHGLTSQALYAPWKSVAVKLSSCAHSRSEHRAPFPWGTVRPYYTGFSWLCLWFAMHTFMPLHLFDVSLQCLLNGHFTKLLSSANNPRLQTRR